MLTNPHGTARFSLISLLTFRLLAATLFLGGIRSPLQAQVVETKLMLNDGAVLDYFGSAVSIDNDRAIVGAYNSAYIFEWNGAAWVEAAKLTASDAAAAGDDFGRSVSIDDDWAIVGDKDHDDNGAAYVFKWNGTAWMEEAKLLASDGAYTIFLERRYLSIMIGSS